MRAAASEAGLDVTIDSAGTGAWHVGNPPDRRAQAEARRNGVDISGLRARQAVREDFHRFTHIFAADHSNLADLLAMAPDGHQAHVGLLLDEVAGMEGQAVADPYYGDDHGFERTWSDVHAAAKAIAARLAE